MSRKSLLDRFVLEVLGAVNVDVVGVFVIRNHEEENATGLKFAIQSRLFL